MQNIFSGDRPDSEKVNKQTFPTTVGGLEGLNRPAVQRSERTAMKIYAYLILPGAGSEYNTRTGNNVAKCPGGAKKNKAKKNISYSINYSKKG